MATSFSQGPSKSLSDVPILSSALLALAPVLPETFLPFFAWSFFSGFPRIRTLTRDRFAWWGRTCALVLGAFLFLANLLPNLPGLASAGRVLEAFDHSDSVGAYWFLLMGFSLPAFGYALWRAHRATAEERRRTSLLLFGFVLGSLPVLLLVVLSAVSQRFYEALIRPPIFFLSQVVVYGALLSIPVTTGYAVLARGALGVRLILRAAIRYALARRTVTFLTLLPLVGMAVVLFVNREQSLTSLVAGPSGAALLVAMAIGFLGLRFRNNALRSLDERFFREQYDARKILGALVHGVRSVDNLRQLQQLLSEEIERALHPRFVLLLTLNPVSRVFESLGREVPPLPEISTIAGVLRGSSTPVEASALRFEEGHRLSEMEKHWLMDSDARLMVPLMGEVGELIGVILLADRRSELPYSREDRGLLVDIAAAAAGTLERRLMPRMKTKVRGPMPEERAGIPGSAERETADECESCGQLGLSDTGTCPVCGGSMEEAPVPLQIRGVYRVECRIGEGGMGLVYRALDMNLNRHVALKTLLRADRDLAARLRMEARAMASVSHPNLATIYGAETWKGRPLILEEFFGAGTLEGRLRKGPLSITDSITLGIHLSRGVAHLHELGMLHRDIKPSNIGLSNTREPKLLDFGLVQFLSRRKEESSSSRSPASDAGLPKEVWTNQGSLERTRPGMFKGTLPYLSPEVLGGEPNGPGADLWSLAVVLFEAIAGKNPFMAPGGAFRVRAPDLRTFQPECPPEVADFFHRALAYDPDRRPAKAKDMERGLKALV